MERWHIPSISSEGRREPRVLFSSDEARAVVIDLRAGEQLGEHSVHERAVLQVVSGQVSIGGQECEAGTLVMFAPNERHAVAALSDARLLLLLAPWPGQGHYADGVAVDAGRTPAQVTVAPLD
jgi:redox-sensitive bicupin YhaK (pirin superfamily)